MNEAILFRMLNAQVGLCGKPAYRIDSKQEPVSINESNLYVKNRLFRYSFPHRRIDCNDCKPDLVMICARSISSRKRSDGSRQWREVYQLGRMV